MTDLKIKQFADLYNLFADLDLDILTAMDLIEELLPTVESFSALDQVSAGELIVDDTTAKMSRDLREACEELLLTMQSIIENYSGISNQEVRVFIKILPKVLVSLSLIAYSAYGFNKVIEASLSSTGIDLSSGVYSRQVIEIASVSLSEVHNIASIVVSVMQEFKPYLPEYVLADEEIADLQDAIFAANLPSDALASLSPEFVQKILGGGH